MQGDLERASCFPDRLARKRAQAATAARSVLAFGLLMVLSASAQGADSQRGSPPQGPPWIADELLVGVGDALDRGQAEELYRSVGAEPIDEIPQIHVHRVRVPPEALERVQQALSRHQQVAFVEKNRLFAPDATPDDPDYPDQWHLPVISAPQVWDLVTGSSDVVIAILDSGVDPTHPDLVGKLVPGFNFDENNTDTADVYGHGTRVAGAATAIGNNGIGVASVAWDNPLMPIRVARPDGWATVSAIAAGLTYAVDHGVRVMNVSFGGIAASPTILAASRYVVEHGGVVVGAAGNCGCIDSTPPTPYILSVSATDRSDGLASFSSTGSYVDLAAPGVGIRTTSRGGGYGSASGTSFASPVVAGVIALMLSVDPDLSAEEIESILAETAEDLGAAGYDTEFGYGRVDSFRAVLGAMGEPMPIPDTLPPSVWIEAPAEGETLQGSVAISIGASDDIGVAAVELYLDGGFFARDTSAPFAFSWNSEVAADGAHELTAVAYDAAGNSASAVVTVTLRNSPDAREPDVRVTSPASGSEIAKMVQIRVQADDDRRVERVDVYVDGVLIGSDACGLSSCSTRISWRSRSAAMGTHEISARAVDDEGNVGTSAPVTVYRTR
jgi:thermitase